MNIKLKNRYRDASNYKQHGFVIYSNPSDLPLEAIRDAIVENLFEGKFFNARRWGIPELFFETQTEDDHQWHEFDSIEYCNESICTKTIDGAIRSD